MLHNFLISKKEIGKFRLSLKNPVEITRDKVSQTPRIFNTKQIRSAIDNLSFNGVEEMDIPPLLIYAANFILKDFFL